MDGLRLLRGRYCQLDLEDIGKEKYLEGLKIGLIISNMTSEIEHLKAKLLR